MNSYLNQQFNLSDENLVSIIDELPLWSSYFGVKILDKVTFKPDINILDIGCGTGFPLTEIAQRFGSSSNVYGIDPWAEAIERIRLKIKTMHLNNVNVIEGKAEQLPFENNIFDLIVSNNGINNVEDAQKVMNECYRVSKRGAQFVFTVNLPDSMIEFYIIFKKVLLENGLHGEAEKMNQHILSKRKTLEMNIDLINNSGFEINNYETDQFYMRFLNGTAFFNHHFIKLAFLDSWKKIVPENLMEKVFNQLEDQLNKQSEVRGEFSVTIPFVCFECGKQ